DVRHPVVRFLDDFQIGSGFRIQFDETVFNPPFLQPPQDPPAVVSSDPPDGQGSFPPQLQGAGHVDPFSAGIPANPPRPVQIPRPEPGKVDRLVHGGIEGNGYNFAHAADSFSRANDLNALFLDPLKNLSGRLLVRNQDIHRGQRS